MVRPRTVTMRRRTTLDGYETEECVDAGVSGKPWIVGYGRHISPQTVRHGSPACVIVSVLGARRLESKVIAEYQPLAAS
jgi:hypothetical protein